LGRPELGRAAAARLHGISTSHPAAPPRPGSEDAVTAVRRRVENGLGFELGFPRRYCIVKDKARLGTVVNQKTCACACLVSVRKEDQHALDQLRSNFKAMYNDVTAHQRKWGGGIMGLKTQRKLEKREKALAEELAKKAQY